MRYHQITTLGGGPRPFECLGQYVILKWMIQKNERVGLWKSKHRNVCVDDPEIADLDLCGLKLGVLLVLVPSDKVRRSVLLETTREDRRYYRHEASKVDRKKERKASE